MFNFQSFEKGFSFLSNSVLSDPWRWEDMSCLLDKIFSTVYGFSRLNNRLYELELNILLACLSPFSEQKLNKTSKIWKKMALSRYS